MLELTSLGQRVADDVGSRKHLQGISAQAEILLELERSEPIGEDQFLHRVQEMNYSKDFALEALDNLRDLGLVGE